MKPIALIFVLILLASCQSLEPTILMSQQYIKDSRTYYATTIVNISDTSLTVNGQKLHYEGRLVLPRYTTWFINQGQARWYYGDKIVFSDSKGHDFCTLVYLLEKND